MAQTEQERKLKEQEDIENLGVKIIGGFFIYRASPKNSELLSKLVSGGPVAAPVQTGGGLSEETASAEGITGGDGSGMSFGQKGEITGMVLIKQYGERQYMGYAPVDPKTGKLDKFMTYFSDTALDNAYDKNTTNVFDLGVLHLLINKMIIQPMSDEPVER
jgi:hypothetical protein